MEKVLLQFGETDLEGIELLHGDATDDVFRDQMNSATHIYCYDYIFNNKTFEVCDNLQLFYFILFIVFVICFLRQSY